MAKRLYRSRTDKMVSGVCGGFATYFDIDPTLIRLGVAALILVSGFFPGIAFYIICAIIIPEEPVLNDTAHETATVVVEPKMPDDSEAQATSAEADNDAEVIVEPRMKDQTENKVSLDK